MLSFWSYYRSIIFFKFILRIKHYTVSKCMIILKIGIQNGCLTKKVKHPLSYLERM